MRSFVSSELGFLEVHNWKVSAILSWSLSLGRVLIILFANAWAASWKTSLPKVANAVIGLLEILRFVIETFASGQSKVIRLGSGAVRLKNVYIPRRYRSSPWLVFHLKLPAKLCSATPSGTGGNTLGPPILCFISPDEDRKISRTISPSILNLFCLW